MATDEEPVIRILETVRRSPFPDVDLAAEGCDKTRIRLELPREQRTYDSFLKHGWYDVTDQVQ